jgi:CBS domain-containing protein
MDGGRVLRAVLASHMDYFRATQIAARIGQALAFVFAAVGLFGIPGLYPTNPMLLFIALFVWMAASEEASMVQIRTGLGGIPAHRAMIREFQALAPTETLKDAVAHILAGFQQDFPVLDGDRLVGILPRAELMRGLAEVGTEAPVGAVMRRDFHTVDPHVMLDAALRHLRSGCCPVLPVVHGGQLVGLITLENLSELLMIRQALGQAPREGPAARPGAPVL